MNRLASIATLALISSFSGSADASGWDWDEPEFTSMVWTQPIQTWALIVSDDPNLTNSQLVQSFTAPPAEPWCDSGPPPTINDCNTYLNAVDSWIVDFNNLESAADIPSNLPIMPAPMFCPSSCLI